MMHYNSQLTELGKYLKYYLYYYTLFSLQFTHSPVTK